MGADQPRRVLFVTGKLAEPALRRTLTGLALPFAWDIAVMRITVAALMTTPWIARALRVPEGTDLVLIPGLCEGDVQAVREACGVPVEKGPKDLRDIPRYFGDAARRDAYGAWTIEILAEINDAPRLTREALRAAATYYRASGADVIDIGCTPGVAFPTLHADVRELVAAGLRVSVDTFDPGEIRAAAEGGAELILSINGSNLDAAEALSGSDTRVVAIPDLGGGLETLEPTLDRLEQWRVPYLIDPILEPIGHGFMASLERYGEVRRRYPDAGMLMGIGNLTELTAADSTGITAVLMAICEELRIGAVLTTEVAPWTFGAVREADIARRLMHYAVTGGLLPKGIDDRLLTIKDAVRRVDDEDELRRLQAAITDPNFRIFADPDGITVLNAERFVRGTDIQGIFDQLGVEDPAHAFYLGKELARAGLAMRLRKSYRQEGALSWGYLTPPEDPRREHVRLSQPAGRVPSVGQTSPPPAGETPDE